MISKSDNDNSALEINQSSLTPLIKRLWKFVKKKCLYSKYYDKFPAFKAAITNCLDKLDTDHKKELTQLMTTNFQTFKNVQVLTL
ncbi:MAG: hypothetical protein QJT81_20665 [Candidatus Thiothrix putei]|uniref:Uncharacterized protein n=1 Tax=Candidatus Thiothrix putei TaxID=3080811 RepID=A0AA95HDB6_9GAMM|nr:MAG: hypothetical protein QJT81_20665 [Candidatus Thiothrix putei]